jgi:hypothetical protein
MRGADDSCLNGIYDVEPELMMPEGVTYEAA